jgi:hypothetical protein
MVSDFDRQYSVGNRLFNLCFAFAVQEDFTSGEIRIMMINPDLIAPCGLYCGVCAIYIAHRDNNEKFKARLLNLYQGQKDTIQFVTFHTDSEGQHITLPMVIISQVK